MTESIPTDWKTVFRELLRSALLAGRPSLPKIGLALGLHPRTLQRRLRAEGTSYRELLNEVRLELACLQLTEDHSSIARIAERLGYGATAAFTKAFHRWAGVPPSAYRKANRAAP